MFAKTNAAKLNSKANDVELEKHMTELAAWIRAIQPKKEILAKALTYF